MTKPEVAQVEIPDGNFVRGLTDGLIARFPITHAQADHFRSPIAKEMGWDKKKRPIDSDEMEDRPEMFMVWEQAEALAS